MLLASLILLSLRGFFATFMVLWILVFISGP
jgi:hypothetical protein